MTRLAMISLLFAGCILSNVQADDATITRFSNEAEPGWEDYARRIARYECETESEWHDKITDETRFRGSGLFSVSGTWGVAEGESSTDTSRLVMGRNSEYSFRLRRTNDLWYVEELTWNALQSADAKRSPLDGPDAPGLVSFCRCLMVGPNWLPAMVRSPAFKVVSANVEPGSDGLVRLEFQYEPGPGRDDYVREGSLLLDSRSFWIIREAETKGLWADEQAGEIRIRNEFHANSGDVPLLALHEMHWVAHSENVETLHHVRRTTYQNWKPASTDEQRYQLSHYGIPEPHSPTRGRGLFRRTLLLVNGVAAGLLLLWLYLRKRPRPARVERIDGAGRTSPDSPAA